MTSKSFGLFVLICAVLFESGAQLCLKLGAITATKKPTKNTPWLTLGVVLYSIEIVLYTFALNRLNLSVAFPVGSLCFVGVALVSHVYLKEKISGVRWLGIASIVVGSTLVSL